MQRYVIQELTQIYSLCGCGKTKPIQSQSKPILNAHKPTKGAGRKKGVRNFFWVSAAGKDIMLFMGNPILA
jgi:hypothetical protein